MFSRSRLKKTGKGNAARSEKQREHASGCSSCLASTHHITSQGYNEWRCTIPTIFGTCILPYGP
jgi:hypothetical protein